MTLRQHLTKVWDDTGIRPPELYDEPECPSAVQHLIPWFWDLHSGRGSTGFGPAPISYAEIKAWMDLKGEQLMPIEVSALKILDREYLAFYSKKYGKK